MPTPCLACCLPRRAKPLSRGSDASQGAGRSSRGAHCPRHPSHSQWRVAPPPTGGRRARGTGFATAGRACPGSSGATPRSRRGYDTCPKSRRRAVEEEPDPLAPWDEAILAQITRHAPRSVTKEIPIPPPEHLALRFFGGPTATIDEAVVGKDGWRFVEARTLFWYALAHGSRGFSREALGTDLFPELDGEQVGRTLRNTFYALRQMFRKWGIPNAFPMTDGRGVLLPRGLCPSYESDLDVLHAAIRAAGTNEALPTSKLLSLLEQPYMADLQGDWLFPFRAYWNGEAIRALDLAATAAERGGRPQEALLLLRREAEFSPDDPLVSCRILLLAHAMGDHGVLRATYVEHCRISRDDLGVGPDPSVVALYGKLARA